MADEKTVGELARERYQRANDFYSPLRMLAIEDTRFVLGDCHNNWQWPDNMYATRAQQQNKPCLTINITAQHCNQIINQIRQSRPTGRVLPVDSMSDPDTAEVLEGLIRSIQAYSKANVAHDTAATHMVYGGEGYWRVLTEYESDTGFDQVITIKACPNPNLVFIDPDAIEADRSDARWGFIFEDVPKSEVEDMYPDLDPSSWAEDGDRGWVKKDTIRIAEYYWCESVDDALYMLDDGSIVLKSKLPDGVKANGKTITNPDGSTRIISRTRSLKRKAWKWAKLVGGETEPVETKDWAGSYLPIITVVGVEVNVDGEVVRKGIVRDLKDTARMVNYSYSSAVETVAIQNKVPYLVPAEAIEGYQRFWDAPNQSDIAYLPYNHIDENGNPIPHPIKQPPPQLDQANIHMLQLSVEQMRAASGQQQANFGIRSEAASGVGIQRLKAQGEIATFHFPDNLSRALEYEMRVLIDLIPKIYDTQRIVRILGIDGTEDVAHVAPEMQGAYAEQGDGESLMRLFNPSMGRYDVAIDTGPSYQTQRQAAQDSMTAICQANPQVMQIAGDLIMRAYDFPMAEEIAERMKKALPPNLQDHDEKEGAPQIPPQVQQHVEALTQQVQQLGQALEKASEHAEQLEAQNKEKMTGLAIDAYGKETDRMKAVGAAMSPEQVQALVNKTVMEALSASSPPVDAPAPPADGHGPQAQTDAPAPPAPGHGPEEQPAPAMAPPTGAQPGPGLPA